MTYETQQQMERIAQEVVQLAKDGELDRIRSRLGSMYIPNSMAIFLRAHALMLAEILEAKK